ncbi:hypothetical protein EYF80_005662 [Liparis tanakae]|uniref:Uncharacterized protein n=1 Tax=Liparis tanakae TaxID=230148 RepID=A0A4Z2J1K2_9TELE|nr:hypothetical protein EYF80_005662 [Liparis tanakae]
MGTTFSLQLILPESKMLRFRRSLVATAITATNFFLRQINRLKLSKLLQLRLEPGYSPERTEPDPAQMSSAGRKRAPCPAELLLAADLRWGLETRAIKLSPLGGREARKNQV